jgi:hypothetical protein
MRIIIIDGFHKGHVLDWHKPMREIKLLKPKTITVCDCDDPAFGTPPIDRNGERFKYDMQEIAYKVAFTSPDGEVALFSTSGKSMDIFNANFDRAFRDTPWGPNEVLYFGCHDKNSFN